MYEKFLTGFDKSFNFFKFQFHLPERSDGEDERNVHRLPERSDGEDERSSSPTGAQRR